MSSRVAQRRALHPLTVETHRLHPRSDILKRFGENLREARQRRGLSQEKLAAKAGIDRTYVGGVERGERNVALVNIVRLAEALEIAPADLLKGLDAGH